MNALYGHGEIYDRNFFLLINKVLSEVRGMIDVEQLCNVFNEIVKKKSDRIAVYGLGENAKILARSLPEAIFCFCDGKKENGSFEGKPILPLIALPDEGVHTIVIAAGSVAERIVFERIVDFCKREGISIYSTKSGDLNIAGQELSKHSYGQEAKQKLWASIESHDVISFDIFDTLLMRKTLYPSDVFDIVGYKAVQIGISLLPGFKKYRQQAEAAMERDEPGLRGIYKNLRRMLDLSECEIEQLMQLELEVEAETVFPRQAMVEAGRYAKYLSKKVVLVSDMYLPPPFMEKLLAENGIDFYDKLYVSDYCGTSKGQKLFEKVKDDNKATSYLHIGDNPDVDGWSARRHGIDTFLIRSGLDIFRNTGLSQPFKYLEGLNERLLMGLFIARAFANPFCLEEHGRRQVEDCPDFARLFVAPLATSFVIWLTARVKECGGDRILFAARDGYLFQKMYDRAVEQWHLSDMPKSQYLYVSRKLCLGMVARDFTDLEWMRSKLQGQTRHFFNDVFHLNIPMQEDEDGEEVWQDVLMRKEEIFKKSQKRYNRYKRYLEKIDISSHGKYIFVDMCSQGTSQRSLTKEILPNLYGFYFKRYNSKDIVTMGKVESFLPQDNKVMLLNNIFEFFFTSTEPSANDISEDGEVVFNEEARNDVELSECIRSQEAIKNFFDDFIKLALPEKVNRMVGQQLLDLCKSSVFVGSMDIFTNMAISNDLSGGRLPV